MKGDATTARKAKQSEAEGIGARLARREDQALLTGRARFIDDIDLPGQLYAGFVRSPHAHARIAGIDPAAALAVPGVVAVLTGADLAADGVGILQAPAALKGRKGEPIHNPAQLAISADKARHVGDTVAMVLAETDAAAREGAAAVDVDYAALPSVTSAVEALAAGSPRVWDELPSNLAVDWETGNKAAVDAAFASAAHVARLDLVNNRVIVAAMEPRGATAEYDAVQGRYTLYTPTGGGTVIQMDLAEKGLKVPAASVRVVTPEVGGGFGIKNYIYPEQVLVCWAAKRLGRPVKWFATRDDSFSTDRHARDHVMHAELALDGEGRFLAIRCRTVSNMGAYLTASGPIIPTSGGTRMLTNAYRIPLAHAETQCVFTNTTSIAAYRGAGKPEYCYMVERLVDQAARDLDLDPQEIRARNLVRPEDMPYRTPTGLVYDSGDFEHNMAEALRLGDREGFAARAGIARGAGKRRGFGFSFYTEPDGFKDGRVGLQFDPGGHLTLTMTGQTNGQGHATTFAQVAASRLGIPVDSIHVVQGDTDRVGIGTGTGGSRTATVAGTAIYHASIKLVEKGRRIAAQLLEASAEDIEFDQGRFRVAGTDRDVAIQQVARAAFDDSKVPADMELGFDASYHFSAKAYSYPCGCHVAEVEIDEETGVVAVVRYALVSDFGTVINPMLLEGQLHGGIVQGIGQALYEDCRYDPQSGQLVTGSFMDYCLPRATHTPRFDWGRTETMCRTNPLGIKGCGESGPTAAMPAVMNAVMDALKDCDTAGLDMPATPEKVWRVLRSAKGK
ncbi:MAG: molybdopterin-dependent oxidoreductase [Alphaproteobacteria bacterium]|nr:molybdopterin-dependent oxidoreductase [Alphaproteobacteria bacterium]